MARNTAFDYQDFLAATTVTGLTDAVKTPKLIKKTEGVTTEKEEPEEKK